MDLGKPLMTPSSAERGMFHALRGQPDLVKVSFPFLMDQHFHEAFWIERSLVNLVTFQTNAAGVTVIMLDDDRESWMSKDNINKIFHKINL